MSTATLVARPSLEVERILALSNEQLANLRGDACPECRSRDCDHIGCDRCGRHAGHAVTMPGSERIRIICSRCKDVLECSSCAVALPRWRMANVDGDLFCAGCCNQEPTENW